MQSKTIGFLHWPNLPWAPNLLNKIILWIFEIQKQFRLHVLYRLHRQRTQFTVACVLGALHTHCTICRERSHWVVFSHTTAVSELWTTSGTPLTAWIYTVSWRLSLLQRLSPGFQMQSHPLITSLSKQCSVLSRSFCQWFPRAIYKDSLT